jgi:hypothetical protein
MHKAKDIIEKWIELKDPTKILNLSKLGLDELPPIPESCRLLYCYDNNLKSLPDLPNVYILNCKNNQLTSLPNIPRLVQLNCSNNKLTELPNRPYLALSCQNNLLTELPDTLQRCHILRCDNNKLIKIPEIKPHIATFSCFGNRHLLTMPKLKKGHKLHRTYYGEYIYVNKLAFHDAKLEDGNYNKSALIIQRSFKNYMRRKYKIFVDLHLLKGPTSVVCAYI